MTENIDQWVKIVELHQCTKELFLLAEEHESGFKDFLQPIQEQKHAYEHILRAQSHLLGLKTETEEYYKKSLSKALGHEYRSFFDTADWLSMRLREKTINLLMPYTNQNISAICPEYYRAIRPRLEKINVEIAKIREEKDVANEHILLGVKAYKNEIVELVGMINRIHSCIPSLEEYMNKEKTRSLMGLMIKILFWLATVGVTIGAVYLKIYLEKSPK